MLTKLVPDLSIRTIPFVVRVNAAAGAARRRRFDP
jgi:hypothetical protein